MSASTDFDEQKDLHTLKNGRDGEDAWSSGKKSPTNSFAMDAEFRSVKEFKELLKL